jgi:hypothetical protein
MNEPKKGLSPLAWAGIGCGSLLIIGIIVISVGGYFAAKTVADFVGDNPAAAAAEAIVALNPELELVESNREAGTMTVRESSTGKQVTVDYSALERGELSFDDGSGEQVSIDASAAVAAATGGAPITINAGGSTMTIGGAGAATEVPAWLGEFPGTKSDEGGYTGTVNGKRSGIYSFVTDDAAAALAYYEGRLEALELKVDRSSFSGGNSSMESVQGRSEDYNITAAATTNDNEVRMTVTYSGPAE